MNKSLFKKKQENENISDFENKYSYFKNLLNP